MVTMAVDKPWSQYFSVSIGDTFIWKRGEWTYVADTIVDDAHSGRKSSKARAIYDVDICDQVCHR